MLQKLNGEEKGNWGVLNAQQMVEHMIETLQIANGKQRFPLMTPPETLEKWKEFAIGEKEFRPNTKNALMPDEALPCKLPNMQMAIEALQIEINDFINYFKHSPQKTLTNPFFGDLNFDNWIALIYKHARHHLRQFALID